MTRVRMIAAAALSALLVPAVAAAKEASVEGPVALKGAGFFKAELEMGDGDGQRPVRIGGRGGYVGFLDLGGDLEVRCAGKGRAQMKKTEEGTVFLCAGRVGMATVRGSHFKLRGFAKRYVAMLPAGVSGSFEGRFVERDGEAREAGGEKRADRKSDRAEKKDERKQEKKGGDDGDGESKKPTLAELIELLKAQKDG